MGRVLGSRVDFVICSLGFTVLVGLRFVRLCD